ncbi:MAG: hypothetical protein GOU97_03115 [Nanoarchaeota archaeon]|nr:hypothetical protein [Nanoarchaeota archaeon]
MAIDVVRTVAQGFKYCHEGEEFVPGRNFPLRVASSSDGFEGVTESSLREDVRTLYKEYKPDPDSLKYFAQNQGIPCTELMRQLSEHGAATWERVLNMEIRFLTIRDELEEEGLLERFDENLDFAAVCFGQEQALTHQLEEYLLKCFEEKGVLVLPLSESAYFVCSEQEYRWLLGESERYLDSYV